MNNSGTLTTAISVGVLKPVTTPALFSLTAAEI